MLCMLLLACACPGVASAGDSSPPSDQLTLSLDTSAVRIRARDMQWNGQRLQWDRRLADAGLFAAIEAQQRENDSDALLDLGGHRMWAHWIASGQVRLGGDNAFLPRRAIDLALGYRLRPDVVLQIGTTQARHADSNAHLASASLLLYRGDDEWEFGIRGGSAGNPSRRISLGFARGQWRCGAQWDCGAQVSAGRNVFGADELGLDTGDGWIAAAHAAYHLARGNSLRLDVAVGRANDFRQNTIALSYRHDLVQH